MNRLNSNLAHLAGILVLGLALFALGACTPSQENVRPTIGAPTTVPTSGSGQVLVAPSSAPALAPTAAQSATAPVTPAATAAATPVAITSLDLTQNATLGPILADNMGRTVYAFLKDTDNTSNCNGTCATMWPAVTAAQAPSAGSGVNAALIGIINRQDGATQVTYKKHPLYYFSGDKHAGDTNGQGIGTNWYVVSAAGDALRTAISPATSPTP